MDEFFAFYFWLGSSMRKVEAQGSHLSTSPLPAAKAKPPGRTIFCAARPGEEEGWERRKDAGCRCSCRAPCCPLCGVKRALLGPLHPLHWGHCHPVLGTSSVRGEDSFSGWGFVTLFWFTALRTISNTSKLCEAVRKCGLQRDAPVSRQGNSTPVGMLGGQAPFPWLC